MFMSSKSQNPRTIILPMTFTTRVVIMLSHHKNPMNSNYSDFSDEKAKSQS